MKTIDIDEDIRNQDWLHGMRTKEEQDYIEKEEGEESVESYN